MREPATSTYRAPTHEKRHYYGASCDSPSSTAVKVGGVHSASEPGYTVYACVLRAPSYGETGRQPSVITTIYEGSD